MIMVFGKTGQIAIELQSLGNVVSLDRDQADLTNPSACVELINDFVPSAVINAAAYTDVEKADKEERLATIINAHAPAAMAKACNKLAIPFVQISTDYVFNGGSRKPWAPTDPTEPKNAYGRSKLAGEKAIRKSGSNHAILRTSWLFSPHRTNFVKTMLQLSENNDALRVVDDQFGGPTPASAVASACLSIVEQLLLDSSKTGTYHFSGTPNVSWYEFADTIFKMAGRKVILTPISTYDYPTLAKRPFNSRMDCDAILKTFGIPRPDWRKGLSDIIKDLDIPRY